MGSATAKVVPRRLHLRRGNAVASLVRWGAQGRQPAAAVIGDQGYDRDKTRKMLAWQGTTPCTPPRRCRKQPVHDHKRLDRRRHKIETLFSRLKDWQRLTTRYDLCGHVFCSAILLAATVLFW